VIAVKKVQDQALEVAEAFRYLSSELVRGQVQLNQVQVRDVVRQLTAESIGGEVAVLHHQREVVDDNEEGPGEEVGEVKISELHAGVERSSGEGGGEVVVGEV
jgi:hypothetical protein